MQKARTALASAEILLAAGDADGAVNRAYYAMFDAAIATLAWVANEGDVHRHKTHAGLIASFGQHLGCVDGIPDMHF